ncbi:AIPR family protein [Weissella viridescens]|uniref:AIPR family protein n=1 Tax=Weissella viridescens TaxID=1629 RepID=UPI003AF24B02
MNIVIMYIKYILVGEKMKLTFDDAVAWVEQNKILTPQEVDKRKETGDEKSNNWTNAILLLKGMTEYVNTFFPQDIELPGRDLIYAIYDEDAYKELVGSKPDVGGVESGIEDQGIDGLVLIGDQGIITSADTEFNKIEDIILFQAKNGKNKPVTFENFRATVLGFMKITDEIKTTSSIIKNNLAAKFLSETLGSRINLIHDARIQNVLISGPDITDRAKQELPGWNNDIEKLLKSYNFEIATYNTTNELIDHSLVTLESMRETKDKFERLENEEQQRTDFDKLIDVVNLEHQPIYSEKAYAYQGFAFLNDYATFLNNEVKEENEFDSRLVLDNVRGAQGNNKAANKSIRKTLQQNGDENDIQENIDSWWLNNGITIISSGIEQISPRQFKLKNPQIVNGQQTSRQIFNSRFEIFNKDWKVQIKLIIIPKRDEVSNMIRKKIIVGVNTQTAVSIQNIKGMEDTVRRLSNFICTQSGGSVQLVVRQGEELESGAGEIAYPYEFVLQMIVAGILKKPGEARSGVGSIVKKYFDVVYSFKNTENIPEAVSNWISLEKNIANYDKFFRSNWLESFGIEEKTEYGDRYAYIPIFTILNKDVKEYEEGDFLPDKFADIEVTEGTFKSALEQWHNFMKNNVENVKVDVGKYTKSSDITKDLKIFLLDS